MSTQDTCKFESWKAIANYFGRSERTVRRWETQESMPVHRHQHLSGARIYAYQSELEDWFASRKLSKHDGSPTIGATKSEEARSEEARSEEIRSIETRSIKSKADDPNKKLSIGLIPFDFVSEHQSQQYIRDAICEELITDMATLPSLLVISYSSMRFLPSDTDERHQVIDRLQLDFYLEGSLQIIADQVRLSLRLINAKTNEVAWSDRYNTELANWQTLRHRINAAVLNSLPLSNAEHLFESSDASDHLTQTAWEYLHQARAESMKWQPASIERAIQLLTAAQRLVGDNHLILANLGRAYLQLREAAIDCSDEPINKAAEILQTLNQTSADKFFTYSLSGWYHYATGKPVTAIAELKKALALQPNEPGTLGLLSNCYLITGQNDLAKPFIDAVQIVDPLTPLTRCLPGWYALLNGEFKQAIAPYEDMLSMDPHNPVARLFMVWVYAINRDHDAASITCEGFIEPLRGTLPALLSFAIRDGLLGKTHSLELNPMFTQMAQVNEMFARFASFAYASLKDIEPAIDWLEKAFSLGFCAYPFLRDHDPFFRPFADHPRSKKLMSSMKARWLEAAN